MLPQISSLAFLAIAGSAVALPFNAPWTWSVTDFSSVCTAATCRYSFNVSAPAGSSAQPAFDADFCSGNSVQGGYKSCGVVGVDVPGDVKTQEFNQGIDIGAVISVRYSFTQ
ncbi:hypothetical protein DDE82_008412 [Stemphylium lycopersici]|uniref:Uncharacterized protein n=1 Tax=Stemphylium lycopersici TaxID=183478 RepID=A0A364N148_STELY|nr:hypothetical protein TW65_92238 [Stemphylium lycopersici]RAQ99308.1 hypothetical protein DDE82_008412 [Stemphylium lycopersici]RAR08476.1 hypothetical protein DDE83_005959 [Stemphylium lycopersici]